MRAHQSEPNPRVGLRSSSGSRPVIVRPPCLDGFLYVLAGELLFDGPFGEGEEFLNRCKPERDDLSHRQPRVKELSRYCEVAQILFARIARSCTVVANARLCQYKPGIWLSDIFAIYPRLSGSVRG